MRDDPGLDELLREWEIEDAKLRLAPDYLRYRITDPARRRKLQEKCYRLRWNDEALAKLAKNNGVSLDFVLEHLRVERTR